MTQMRNHQIVRLTLQNPARPAIDHFMTRYIRYLREWPLEKPFLCLVEIGDTATVTPYLRHSIQIAREDLKSNLHGRLAITIHNRFQATIINMIAQAESGLMPSVEQRLFTNHQNALAWLCTY